MIQRNRFNTICKRTGQILLSSEATPENPDDFVYAYSDIESRRPLLSRAKTGSPTMSPDPELERLQPGVVSRTELSNGEILTEYDNGKIVTKDGVVIAERKVSKKEGKDILYTVIAEPGKLRAIKENIPPISAYKNFVYLNKRKYPGLNLNELWKIAEVPSVISETERLKSLNGSLKIKVGGEVFEDAIIVTSGTAKSAKTGEDVRAYVVRYTDTAGVEQTKQISEARLSAWNAEETDD